MTDQHGDIGDNEIRIISTHNSGTSEPGTPRRPRRPRWWLYVAAALAVIAIAAIAMPRPDSSEDAEYPADETVAEVPAAPAAAPADTVSEPRAPRAYTAARDTVVGDGIALTILTPENAVPVLELGQAPMTDSTAVLVAQAADIRGDNGLIVGSCVVGGELVSKGQSKAGFCAIIDGQATVGVADTTPLLEQALQSGGYFFRQYPLVVGGQVVENKPRGRSWRKALAEIDGRIRVVVSGQRLTFHDFSQALVDAGARNAIYLVGSTAPVSYTDADGTRHRPGDTAGADSPYVNYIVWR